MIESSKFHPNLDDNLSSVAKSNLAYMSYAVHDFTGQKEDNVSSVSFENGHQVLNTNGLSQNTDSRSQSTWKIHPSLETLLGDFCSEFDVNKKRNSISYPSIGEIPSPANGIKDTNSPNGSSFACRLSATAPEFVPLTPDKLPHSFPRTDNSFTPNQFCNTTLAEPELPPGLQIRDQSLGGKSYSTHEYVSEIPSIKHSQNEHGSFYQPEERDLISFDPDASSRLFKRSPSSDERSSESFKSNPGPLLSENGSSHVSSLGSPHTPSGPQYGEIRPRQCTISPGPNSFDKSAETPLPQSVHDQPEANDLQGAVEKLVEDPASEGKQPLTQISSKRPIFKTYAEAANYFYSLLEEQTRAELFELPSVHVPPSPPPPPPPGYSEHCFERPNWAVARNEEKDLAKMRQQYCSVSAPTNFMTTATAREEYSPADRAYMADHPKPILSPVVREQQVSPLYSNGNGYTEPTLQEPRPLHSRTNRYNPEADDSQDSSRSNNADMYTPYISSSNKGGDQIKPYRKPNNGAVRGGGPAAQNLEREIDEYHENLRAKANRANQISSQRSKSSRNGGGPSNGGGGGGGRGKRGRNSYKRYSNEEPGFDDPVVSGGEGGWGMDNNANTQWGMEPEAENGNGLY